MRRILLGIMTKKHSKLQKLKERRAFAKEIMHSVYHHQNSQASFNNKKINEELESDLNTSESLNSDKKPPIILETIPLTTKMEKNHSELPLLTKDKKSMTNNYFKENKVKIDLNKTESPISSSRNRNRPNINI